MGAVLAATSLGNVAVVDTAHGTIETKGETITTHTDDTETIVREYFRDIPVMAQVARCESTFRHTLADGSVLRGRVDNDDLGVMQINLRYHATQAEELGIDLYDIEGNLAYARYLYEKKGTQPWNASAPCWNRTIAYNK